MGLTCLTALRLTVCIAIAAFGGVLIAPAGAAPAEQIVITLVDEEAEWEFEDPCAGGVVRGVGLESGTLHITETANGGVHVRARVDGAVELFDDENERVGTWTYRLVFTDQIPPGGQGAVHFTASGPITYDDGRTAILHVSHHHVFDKGDIEKFPARDAAKCGGFKS